MFPPSAAPDSTTVWAELRHAEPSDVHFLCRMIYQTAEFQRLTHLVSATDSSLLSTLFPSPPLPPFFSCTPLVLYLSFTCPPVPSPQTLSVTQFSLPSPITDPNEADFASPLGNGHVIAGFVNCFPNYSSFLAKPGLYIEQIFVREPWRRKGLGKFMLSAVVKKAAELGMGRVEWYVLDWNVNAIEFYKGMGAEVFREWRICRLTGPSLEKYKGVLQNRVRRGKRGNVCGCLLHLHPDLGVNKFIKNLHGVHLRYPPLPFAPSQKFRFWSM